MTAKQLCTMPMMMRLVSYFAIIQPKRRLVKENVSGLTATSALLACHRSIWPAGKEQNNKINDKEFRGETYNSARTIPRDVIAKALERK